MKNLEIDVESRNYFRAVDSFMTDELYVKYDINKVVFEHSDYLFYDRYKFHLNSGLSFYIMLDKYNNDEEMMEELNTKLKKQQVSYRKEKISKLLDITKKGKD